MLSKEELIDHYNMQPHPEGGYFVETYRSQLEFDTERGKRSASTAIHFLITKESISHFHRLTSDEGWHFHLGAPLKLLEITKAGKLNEIILGPELDRGQKLQYFVPAGNWFASTSLGDYSFVGCTVAPGFDFADFEMGKKKELINAFPEHSDILEKYCLEDTDE